MTNILLLEPNKMLGETYKKTLEHRGHAVTWCQSAQQAILSTDQVVPDMIVLELQLPLHNGVEFLYELKSYDDLQNIPILILSHVPPTLKAISAILWDQLGVQAYHYKPLTKLTDLTRSVERLLSASRV